MDIDVTAEGPDGTESTSTGSYSQDLPSTHGISLTLKGADVISSDKDGDGKSSAGDVVEFTLTVTNAGSVDLTDVEVVDAALDGLVCQQFIPAAVGEMHASFPTFKNSIFRPIGIVI